MLTLLLVAFLAQAKKEPPIPLLEPQETVQVSGTVKKGSGGENVRQAAIADALRRVVEAAGGKVSENIAGGTAFHWRGRFAGDVVVTSDQVRRGENLESDTIHVEFPSGGATAVIEARLGQAEKNVDTKVIDATFGGQSTTRFHIVREYEAGQDYIVEMAYVLPETAGDMVPISPGRRWKYKRVRRTPQDESATIVDEVALIVEKVEKGLATVRINITGTQGSSSNTVEVEVGPNGPLVRDLITENGRMTDRIAGADATEGGRRFLTEQLQEDTLPGLFASLVGQVPLGVKKSWQDSWSGKTAEGSIEHDEEANVVEASTTATPVGVRASVKLARAVKLHLRIEMGEQGVRRILRTRGWVGLYADGVGCVRVDVTEREAITTQPKGGDESQPATSDTIVTWELLECSGAR